MTDQTQTHLTPPPFSQVKTGAATATAISASILLLLSLGFHWFQSNQHRTAHLRFSWRYSSLFLQFSLFLTFFSFFFLCCVWRLYLLILSPMKIVLSWNIFVFYLLFSTFSDSVFLGCYSEDKVDADRYILLPDSFFFSLSCSSWSNGLWSRTIFLCVFSSWICFLAVFICSFCDLCISSLGAGLLRLALEICAFKFFCSSILCGCLGWLYVPDLIHWKCMSNL